MALDSRTLTAIGTMSGTSFDGVDVALLETDGETVARFGPVGYRAYPNEERLLLQRALAAAASLTDRAARPGPLAEAESLVQCGHLRFGLARHDVIDRRQRLVVHAPAVMQAMVGGDVDDLRLRRLAVEYPGQPAGQVGEVETDDDIRVPDRLGRLA